MARVRIMARVMVLVQTVQMWKVLLVSWVPVVAIVGNDFDFSVIWN